MQMIFDICNSDTGEKWLGSVQSENKILIRVKFKVKVV